MSRSRRLIAPYLLSLLVLAGTGGASYPQAKNAQALDQVLERMGAVGKKFRAFQADFTQQKYTAVLKEFDTPETGIFLYARARDGSAMIRQEVKAPSPRILTIKGGVGLVYQPAIKQASKFNLGKNKDKAEYLALGIGQSPASLRATFDIEYLGTDTVDRVKCSVLLLKPKSTGVAAYFSKITLWMDDATSLPVQQKLEEPTGGNYLLVTFSAEKLNPKISDSQFEQKLPRDVEVQVVR